MSRTRRAASAFVTPPSTRSPVSSSPAHSSGQSGLMQIHRQPSASAWLRLGSSGSPQESQVRAKGSGMGTSWGAGDGRQGDYATIKIGSSRADRATPHIYSDHPPTDSLLVQRPGVVHAGAEIVKAGVDCLLQQDIHVHAAESVNRTPCGPGAHLVIANFDLDKQRCAPGDRSVRIQHVLPPRVADVAILAHPWGTGGSSIVSRCIVCPDTVP